MFAASLGLFQGFDDVENIRYWLVYKCKLRYHHLLLQHHRNVNIIIHQSKNQSELQPHPKMTKSKLIILDLDETILDQREENRRGIHIPTRKHWEELHSRAALKFNIDDLVFGVQRCRKHQSDSCERAHYVIYRPMLLELIEENKSDSNFVMYSLSTPHLLIPHMILIEMYFNYVHRLKSLSILGPRWMGSANSEFHFDYMIGQIRNDRNQAILHKSLPIVTKMIGALYRFDAVFIVDDMAEMLWTNFAPEYCVVFKLKTHKFEICDHGNDFEEMVSGSIRERANDTHFENLNHLIGYLMGKLQTVGVD